VRSVRGVIESEAEDSGQDSFLDVVANVVGVLIILVVMVALQATRALVVTEANPAEEQSQESVDRSMREVAQLHQELDFASRRAETARRATQTMIQQSLALHREAAAHEDQRVQLAMHRAVIEEDIKRRRENLDTPHKDEFDVQRQLVESQLQLDEMIQEKLTLVSTPTLVEVECLPTPLAKTIEGSAIHLRVRHGLVSIVPFERFEDKVKGQTENILRRLRNQDKIEDTFASEDGYRLKLTVFRQRQGGAVSGPIAGQLERSSIEHLVEFLPNSERMGQNVEQALMPGAALHLLLQSHRRQRTPVVVWLYTDSFDEFRILKRTLWEMGLSVAIRPLEPGSQIMASSRGTKASAQ